LLLTREDKSWLLEPSLTEVIAKGAGGMREVSASPWVCEESQPTRIDRLPADELVARCEHSKQECSDTSPIEQIGVALFARGDLSEFVEPAAFDEEADEGLSLAAEGRNTR